MERFLKVVALVTLLAFVAVGTAGCRKKKDSGFDDGGVLIDTDVIPLTETMMDITLFGPPSNPDIYRTIYFDYDKSDLKPESKTVLENIAMDMRANSGIYLLVEGHCDERGTNEYNLALGERRSLSTREYLIGLGILPEMVITISYGEEQPAEQGHTEAAWAKNRRAEFKTYVR